MPKTSNLQFRPERNRSDSTVKTWSVGELTSRIRLTLESQFGQVRVVGEISDLKAAASGHLYFSIKDKTAKLPCVLWRGTRTPCRAELKTGVKVVLEGEITLYEPRGAYQLVVRSIDLHGVGNLHLAFERLTKKLKAEGLFESERKQKLPRYIFRLGLVTSDSGAAIKDVMQVVKRRNPALEMILAPCRVQGTEAGGEIAKSIEKLNRYHQARTSEQRLDAILVTRGGGSLEDLWSFNEEIVARAIAASKLPIVSAIGHEIDYTISDMVADIRAPTPSAAAEIITEDVFASRDFVHAARDEFHRLFRLQLNRRLQAHPLATASPRMRQSIGRQLTQKRNRIDNAEHRLRMRHPRRILETARQRMDELGETMKQRVNARLTAMNNRSRQLAQRLQDFHPAATIAQEQTKLARLTQSLGERSRYRLNQRFDRFRRIETKLQLLSPQNILDRGYSITRKANTRNIVRTAEDVTAGDRIVTTLKQGEIHSEIVGCPQDETTGSSRK